MKNIILFILILGCILSCCKEEDMPIINTCIKGLEYYTEPASETIDSSMAACGECLIDCQEIYSSAIPYNYYYPCFNPNNSNQLAYYRYDNTVFNVTSELWVADFCSGENKKITDNVFYGLDWSVKDWLIYTAGDQNIWKIKSNGDSLTQLTFEGDYNRHPKWSPDGDKILFNAERQGTNFYLISTEYGEVTDTIEELFGAGAWSWLDKNRISYMISDGTIPHTSNLNYYDLAAKEITFLHHLTRGNNNDLLVVNTVSFPEENSILWCARGIIGKTNLTTGTFEILKERLFQEHYELLTLRPDNGEVLINKASRHYEGNCSFDTNYGFFLIDKEGNNQRRVILPE